MKNTLLYTLLAMAATGANAAVIASWENDHLAGDEATTTAGEAPSAGSFDANLAYAPIISRGVGGTSTPYQDTFGFRNGDEASLADALSNERYVTWTIEPGAGFELSLDDVFIRSYTQNEAVNFDLFSDLTGGFTDGNQISSWTAPQNEGTNTITLSGISALQNMQTAVTFRLYYWGKTSAGQYSQVGIGRAFQTNGTQDLTFNGTLAAVPEPATYALVAGLGLLGFVLVRRRR